MIISIMVSKLIIYRLFLNTVKLLSIAIMQICSSYVTFSYRNSLNIACFCQSSSDESSYRLRLAQNEEANKMLNHN